MTRRSVVALGAVAATLSSFAAARRQTPRPNVIIFVADGLRYGSVNAEDAPSLWALRTNGVHCADSYSLFPTFTTANASAIATGHLFGDTGDFSNTIWIGPVPFAAGGRASNPTPFLENDRTLADLDAAYAGSYLGEITLLAAAREHGYNTATIGKTGPTAIQDVAALAAADSSSAPASIVVDDGTGGGAGVPLPAALTAELARAGVPAVAPSRSNGYAANSPFNNGFSGDRVTPGTRMANVVQQQWFASVATEAVLPMFTREDKPFVLVYWSRDPDASQHYEGDSLDRFDPGINGPTSRAGVRNADRNLGQLLAWLDGHPAIKARTDVFVTSDHGFATISRREIDRGGRLTASPSAQHDYVRAGAVETAAGTLPNGFLAIDLARDLHLNLFDPDAAASRGATRFAPVEMGPSAWTHPAAGNGLIGESVLQRDASDAVAIVCANGGSDLIYVPNRSPEVVRSIVGHLLTYDYVDGVFVDDAVGAMPGALPLSVLGFGGASRLPRPTIVVAFKVFYRDPADLQTAVQVSDTVLREGQGMHGGFGRESTFNNMAAIGPDFRSRFPDALPASNADIAPTLARVMGFVLPSVGMLRGRVLTEALAGGTGATAPPILRRASEPAADGRRTVLFYREFGGERYNATACLGTDVPGADACRTP